MQVHQIAIVKNCLIFYRFLLIPCHIDHYNTGCRIKGIDALPKFPLLNLLFLISQGFYKRDWCSHTHFTDSMTRTSIGHRLGIVLGPLKSSFHENERKLTRSFLHSFTGWGLVTFLGVKPNILITLIIKEAATTIIMDMRMSIGYEISTYEKDIIDLTRCNTKKKFD